MRSSTSVRRRPSSEQQSVVEAEGLVVVPACPGSGKTFTIAHRAHRILKAGGLSPHQGVAILSFTNVAKDTIGSEYRRIAGTAISHPHFVGTIDSFLNTFVFRPHGSRVMGRVNEAARIIDVNSHWLDDRYPRLASWRLSAQNVSYDTSGNVVVLANRSSGIDMGYLAAMKSRMLSENLATQSDVHYLCLKLFSLEPRILTILMRRFPYVFVDEAQDCSETQMALVDLLVAKGHGQIMLAGDPFQAIYEWRDANPGLLMSKSQNTAWSNVPLNMSKRSGPAICNFLNRFHATRTIVADSSERSLRRAQVEVSVLPSAADCLEHFVKRCKQLRIPIDPETVAVIYGGHRSKINFWNPRLDPASLFATSVAGHANVRAAFSMPLIAKLGMVSGHPADARSACERFLYWQLEKRFLRHRSDLDEHVLADIEGRVLLWRFCRALPEMSLELDKWIERVNALGVKTLRSLRKSASYVPIKKKQGLTGFGGTSLSSQLMPGGAAPIGVASITLQNVHQIKGRTFDAVMVYTDKGNYKFGAKKLVRVVQGSDLFAGNNHEDGRCFYVACSRARKLLWIAGGDPVIQAFSSPTPSVGVAGGATA